MRRTLCLVLGALSFVYLICLVNLIQMLSLAILPFSRSTFRAVNRACASHIWGFWIWMCEHIAQIDIHLTGDDLPPEENAVLVCNHQSMADIMVLLWLGRSCGRLGDIKFFVKDILKYVPGPGWGMVFLDCVFLKRDWAVDKASIDNLFSKYKNEQIPLFLVSFLEGTRFRPSKLARAQAFARDRGLHMPEHTLIPRTKGFLATLHGLHSHLDAVYDITLAYERRPAPSLFDCFAMRVRTIHMDVRRTPIAQLPIGDEPALEQWVYQRYREKDRLLAQHLGTNGQTQGIEAPDLPLSG